MLLLFRRNQWTDEYNSFNSADVLELSIFTLVSTARGTLAVCAEPAAHVLRVSTVRAALAPDE